MPRITLNDDVLLWGVDDLIEYLEQYGNVTVTYGTMGRTTYTAVVLNRPGEEYPFVHVTAITEGPGEPQQYRWYGCFVSNNHSRHMVNIAEAVRLYLDEIGHGESLSV